MYARGLRDAVRTRARAREICRWAEGEHKKTGRQKKKEHRFAEIFYSAQDDGKKRRGPPLLGGPLLATRTRRFVRSAGTLVLYGQDVDCAGGAQAYYVGLAGFGVVHQPIFSAIVLGQMPYHFANIRDPGCAQRMPLRKQPARYVH